jgi:hypothetical protein
MRIDIPFQEIEEFLLKHHQVHVRLKSFDENKIKVFYFISFIFTLKEIQKNKAVFQYEVNVFENILAKGAHCFLKNKLMNAPVEWNSKTKEVTIDLKKIQALDRFLQLFYISEFRFGNENIVLVLKQNQMDE